MESDISGLTEHMSFFFNMFYLMQNSLKVDTYCSMSVNDHVPL